MIDESEIEALLCPGMHRDRAGEDPTVAPRNRHRPPSDPEPDAAEAVKVTARMKAATVIASRKAGDKNATMGPPVKPSNTEETPSPRGERLYIRA